MLFTLVTSGLQTKNTHTHNTYMSPDLGNFCKELNIKFELKINPNKTLG